MLASRRVGGSRDRVIHNRWIKGKRFAQGMDGAAHEPLPVELRAGAYRLAIGRKMNSIRAARVSNLGITVHRQTGSELAGNRQELLRECDLIGPRQVLLA